MLPLPGQPIRNEAIANPVPEAVAVAFGPPVAAWLNEKVPEGRLFFRKLPRSSRTSPPVLNRCLLRYIDRLDCAV